jgi:hypothetical protein
MASVQSFLKINKYAARTPFSDYFYCVNDGANRYLCGFIKEHSPVSTQHSAPRIRTSPLQNPLAVVPCRGFFAANLPTVQGLSAEC